VKHKRIFVLLIIVSLTLLLGLGYGYASRTGWLAAQGFRQADQPTPVPQAVARLGTLTVSTSGAGRLAAVTQAGLGFRESGTILEMGVRAGDHVRRGDLLARLQVDTTPARIAAELAASNLAVLEAQQSLDALSENAPVASAQALVALETAKLALEAVQNNGEAIASARQDLAAAQQAVEDAAMQVDILISTPSSEAVEIAHASLLFKEKDLQELEKQISRLENAIKNAPSKNVRDQLKRQLLGMNITLLQQQSDLQVRQDRYNAMNEPADPLELSLAQATLNTARLRLAEAQRNLEKAQSGESAAELARLEAEFAVATADWEQLENGPDPDKVALAEAELSAAQARLALAEQGTTTEDLLAPFDGVVLSVTGQTGDRFRSGAVLTLANLDKPLVDVYLDEADFGLIKVGNPASVVFDALPDKTYTGKIIEINPGLVQIGGDDVVQARLSLDLQPEVGSASIPVGSNATVDIISAQVEGVVLIPIEALHETPAGGFGVYVVQHGAFELRNVTPGLQDATTVEIIAGLTAGEAVAIGDVTVMEGAQ
jgi:RND family efflux transporter MFP subunit